jgi:hypothetical protein
MKTKFTVGLMVALTGLLFLAVGVLTAAEAPKPPDKILINNKGFKRILKGPVLFQHKKHSVDYKLACTECHHNYENGKNVWKEGDPVKPCRDCHNPLKKVGKIPKLQNAYHKDCKNCHRDLAKAGKKTGPFKKCNECHEKKS